jgi:hypothetical protein
MVIIAPISGPNVQSSRMTEPKGPNTRVLVKESLATTMPSDRQTSLGIVQLEANKQTSGDYDRWKKSRIFNPKQASVAITSENFLKSRAGFEPIYMHNIGATKLALMSVMDKEKPRYSEQINILA